MRAAAIAKLQTMKTGDITAALSGAQFLLGMVETRRASSNGGGNPDSTAPQELEKVEQQIGKLEALDGQSDEVRQQIEDLRERVLS